MGETREIVVDVAATDVCAAGVPIAITNVASVENRAGPDPDPSNDSAESTIVPGDTTPPSIACNAPGAIFTSDAPLSYRATAEDACDAAPVVEVVGFVCSAATGRGRRIDKAESCVVQVAGDTITIEDSGGVGDLITWTVRAVDAAEDDDVIECAAVMQRPGGGH